VVIHFSTSACVHSYTVADLRIHPNRLQIHTQVVTLAGPRAGVLGASSHACLGPAASEGGPMTRGLGRIPRIRGTLTQARDEAGNDMSAGRYTPTSGRTGHPTDGTGGKGKTEGSPGRRRPGLAPGASGWPWHPRRLATARHRGTRGGLVWGGCARNQRCPAAWQRSCDRGHGAHPASRRSTVLYRHVLITTWPGRRTGPLRAATHVVVLPGSPPERARVGPG